jgi:hypothetical protein
MIRNIMGCLIAVGQGKKPPQWMAKCWLRAHAMLRHPPFRPTACIFRARSTNPIGACPTAPLRMIGCHDSPSRSPCLAARPQFRKATAPPLTRTRIKICGLTREQDVDAAVAAGAMPSVSCCMRPALAPSRRSALPNWPPPAALCHPGAAVRQRVRFKYHSCQRHCWRALPCCNFMVMKRPECTAGRHLGAPGPSCAPRAFPLATGGTVRPRKIRP